MEQPYNTESSGDDGFATVVANTPFDKEAIKEASLSAIGAGAITVVVATGVIFVAAGVLKLITWATVANTIRATTLNHEIRDNAVKI